MATTLETFEKTPPLFLSVTLLVVAPVTLLLKARGRRELLERLPTTLNGADGRDESRQLIYAVVVPAS